MLNQLFFYSLFLKLTNKQTNKQTKMVLLFGLAALQQYNAYKKREMFSSRSSASAAPAFRKMIALVIFFVIIGLIIFITNIMGLLRAVHNGHTGMAISSFIGTFIGLPIGSVYYFMQCPATGTGTITSAAVAVPIAAAAPTSLLPASTP
jgi:hypothetical protein